MPINRRSFLCMKPKTVAAMISGGIEVTSVSHVPNLMRDETFNTPQTPPLLMSRCLALGLF